MIMQTQEDHPLVEAAALAADQLALVREIYDEAFPADLRVPFGDLLADRLLVRLDPDGRPEGLAVVRALGTTGWTFLRYYAVGARGGGTGSAMLDQLATLLAREGGALLVWDVEDPDEPGLDAEHVEEHRRRIRFYERNAGELLPVVDYRPPHDGDLAGHAPPMRLMCRTLGAWVRPPVADIVRVAYEHRYGLAGDHPVVRRTLEASALP
ncbi:hypothetical protein NOK12_26660 [Nocardioides sp. OK12]|uniref:GNAT superfamily N-acetyltransferase n=2 Tax=Nocardioidaceae TaxID=85015 RepID=A0A7Y9JT02_9ACTN|nr:hypothetical protein [Nocardioides marinisabuli]NYD59033.1 GNAT superfamily N-acetyltransferase [Nocardioides marinisabuli]GHJ60148.1 hypothetical protein NOK12_26660 [Nocardioides sp. OK12]